MSTPRSVAVQKHTVLIALMVILGAFAVIFAPDLRVLYTENYAAYMHDGNYNGVPDISEDTNLNGIADMNEDSDQDGISNLFERYRPVAPAFAENGSQCTDGVDNDADSFIDMADSGCVVPGSVLETKGLPVTQPASVPDSETACDDGIDNDADSMVDGADPDCASIVEDDEKEKDKEDKEEKEPKKLR
jgi:hypothetical protein